MELIINWVKVILTSIIAFIVAITVCLLIEVFGGAIGGILGSIPSTVVPGSYVILTDAGDNVDAAIAGMFSFPLGMLLSYLCVIPRMSRFCLYLCHLSARLEDPAPVPPQNDGEVAQTHDPHRCQYWIVVCRRCSSHLDPEVAPLRRHSPLRLQSYHCPLHNHHRSDLLLESPRVS